MSLIAGPTHVLVVRGLDENVNEESLHYEFSKYAPIKVVRKSTLLLHIWSHSCRTLNVKALPI